MRMFRSSVLLALLQVPVALLMAQAPPPAPDPGTFMGIDTTPVISQAALQGSYGANIPGNLGAMQSQLNVAGGAPGATSVPATVDPYIRDAAGNITYDALGNPIMKTQAQIDSEQAALDAARAQQAAGTGPGTTMQPGNGVDAVADYTLTIEQANAAKVSPPGDAPTTDMTQTAVVVPPSTIDNAAFDAASGNSAVWNTTQSGVSTTGGTVSIDPAAGSAGVAAVANMLGGGPTGAQNIGDPGNPVVLSLPPVCKCCGAPISKQHVIDGYKIEMHRGYGAVATQSISCPGRVVLT